MNRSGYRTVGFCGQYVTIIYSGLDAEALVDFLCIDLPAPTDLIVSEQCIYNIAITRKNKIIFLHRGEELLYFGQCRYSLAYVLINDIIYQLIADNDYGHAIHAAAVMYNDGCLLLPGKSGTGKSTLTSWLVSRGCHYLTDELIIIRNGDRRVYPFTRPINIKAGATTAVSSFLTVDKKRILVGQTGFMLPHRLINTDFSLVYPSLSHILFPEYKTAVPAKVTRITSAEGCLKLMGCYVNARNFRKHGISKMAAMVRNIPFYKLTYGSFDDLTLILSAYFPGIFKNERAKKCT